MNDEAIGDETINANEAIGDETINEAVDEYLSGDMEEAASEFMNRVMLETRNNSLAIALATPHLPMILETLRPEADANPVAARPARPSNTNVLMNLVFLSESEDLENEDEEDDEVLLTESENSESEDGEDDDEDGEGALLRIYEYEAMDWFIRNHMMAGERFMTMTADMGFGNDLFSVRMQLFTMLKNLEQYFAPHVADAVLRDLGQRYRFPVCPGFQRNGIVNYMSIGHLLAKAMEHPIMGGEDSGDSILAVNSSLPLSVWPLVLEKAGSTDYIIHASETNDRRFDAVHHLLQNAVTMQSWLREKRCKVVVGNASAVTAARGGESISPTVEAVASSSSSDAVATTGTDFKCCVIM